MKTLYAVALSIAAPLALWLGYRRSLPEASPPPLGVENAPLSDSQNSPKDLSDELISRSRLSAEDGIQKIHSWMESSDALANQFPLYDAIARLEYGSFPSIAAQLSALDSEPAREALAVLYLRWRNTDPFALARYREQQQPSGKNEPMTLQALIETQSYLNEASTFKQFLVAALNVSPKGAYKQLDQITDYEAAQTIRLEAIAHISRSDPHLSLDLLRDLFPDYKYKQAAGSYQALSQIGHNLIGKSPSDLTSWYESQNRDRLSTEIIRKLLESSGTNSIATLDLAALLPPSQDRVALLNRQLPNLAREDWDGAIAWLEQNLDSNSKQAALSALAGSGDSKSRNKRVKLLEQITSPQLRNQATRQLVANWARDDLQAAIDWSRGLSSNSQKQIALNSIAPIWIQQDLDGFDRFIEDLPNSKSNSDLRDTLRGHLHSFRLYSPSVPTLETSGKSQQTKTHLIAQHTTELLYDDPQKALDILVELYATDPDSSAQATASIARRWVEFDPVSAGQAILPLGGKRTADSLSVIFNNVARSSPEDIIPLLELVADNRQRETAIQHLTFHADLVATRPDLFDQMLQLLDAAPREEQRQAVHSAP
ncbi:hypothetical protein [Pelagicoccus sp. SDUM812002]|uniref:hypothetical protein n=1 Tax=Pelagicoccus sp. SDUM812002 TaxID=3041266 RepID=UPI00280CE2FC|nr:hypothetical protein [Pelagicoccus sp. SDUM812002]MDQ8187636.1 hypothetical protein [Pelagicoccus sp. SDUM812002]